MQRLAIGVLVGAALVMLAQAAISRPERLFAQGGNRQGPIGALITHSDQLPDGRQQLTVLDTGTRVVAVYHIDQTKGELVLRSVRNIYWDLQMNHFNGTSPLPAEIRSLLEQN